MAIWKALIFGTVYTLVGFLAAFLFLHLTTTIVYHESAVDFLNYLDSGRSAAGVHYAQSEPGSWKAVLLSDKVYHLLIVGIIMAIWLLNVLTQLNKTKED